MFEWLPEKLVEEGREKPYTMMSLIIVIVVVVWLATDHVSTKVFNTTVQEIKAQIGGLREQLETVDYTLAHDHLDTRKHNVERDLFEVNRMIAAEERVGKAVDAIYYARRDELIIQQDDITQEMSALERNRRH